LRLSRRFLSRRVTRSPLVFWAAVVALALLTASVVSGAIGNARSLAARYGPLRPLVVAVRPVERGTVLAAADVAIREVPATYLPEGSPGDAGLVVGRVVVVPLQAGEAVLPGHLAPEGLSAVTALLPSGRRAVSVPAGSSAPPLQRGDTVDLLATLDGDATLAVAVDAPVVDVAADAATVAVTPAEAKAVALALSQGAVTVALTPGPGPGAAARVSGSG
jgi:pilus assembly protein CpaB